MQYFGTGSFAAPGMGLIASVLMFVLGMMWLIYRAELEKCYLIAPLKYQGRQHILVAAKKQNRCILFDAEGKGEGPVDVMTMVQVPGKDGQFLATHRFYLPNDSKEAKIVIATADGKGNWEIRTLVNLPLCTSV